MNAKEILVPQPGAVIAEEIEERGWSQEDLAYIMGVPVQSVNAIIGGKRGISPEMAKALGLAFAVDPAFFLNMQRIYELSQAREPDAGIAVRSRIQGAYPYRDMVKREWIEETSDPSELESQFCAFFGVRTLGEVPHLTYSPKKSLYDKTPPPQLAWLFRAKQLATAMPCGRYSEKGLRQLLNRLHELLIDPEEARHVPGLLYDVGVRYVVIEPLPRSKIDGVCFWLDSRSPVIGMSLRYDRIDNFWFVLRHEIEHVLRKDGRVEASIDAELEGAYAGWDGSLPPEEREANRAAADFIIPSAALDDFVLRVKPTYSENRIVLFARSLGIHPGLVVGQLQNQGAIRYSNFRKYLVRIRNIVISTALTDGWGNTSVLFQ